MKPSGAWFLEWTWSRRLGVEVKEASRWPWRREARLPLWVRPHPRRPLVAPLTDFFHLYMSIYPKNIRDQNRSGDLPPEASVATKSQSRPVSAPCRRAKSLSGDHLHHLGALHDEEGVVHPRAEGMYQELCVWSLSLSCSWGDTILMYRELCYCSWILWCFSPFTLLWWIEFSLWSYLIRLSL